jgi:Fe-S cluster assembly protein SufD
MAAPEAGTVLTFVDGQYAPQWSHGADGMAGTLAQGLPQHAAAAEPYLAQLAGVGQDVFAALNTAWLRDGALVVLGRNVQVERPVHLRFVTTRGGAAVCPRVLVVAAGGARCTVIEDYVALTADAYFTNAVTEIAVAPGAEVHHVRLQREALQAMHIGTVAVAVAQDARYSVQSIAMGGRLSRLNLDIRQGGPGCDVRIDGLALIDGEQVADTHSAMDHAYPHGSCTQLHKTIAGGAAHAVFNGKVLVREGAQLTQAAQQSRNLLLSPRARVDTKPQLEIFADDVKCAHGATVGQLDAEQLFYLVSRGLSADHAHSLLTYAFGAEIVERIPVPSLVAQLRQAVMRGTQGSMNGGTP